ncbi:hypothetical protein [Sphingomonas sp. IW22]|uniref:hypothetical protein n=1 Tax=Sphingomonas sp. IW22 TaxID=3242489 RepID=UPI00351FD2B9
MTRRLRAEADKVEQEADKRGHPARHRTVTIAEVSSDEAYDRLDWFEHRLFARDLVSWKQGRTQRSQHRFVGELPGGLSAVDRHEILSRFCGTLAEDSAIGSLCLLHRCGGDPAGGAVGRDQHARIFAGPDGGLFGTTGGRRA